MRIFIIKALATGFGLGYLPKAPGTWGTLLGIPLFLGLSQLGIMSYMALTAATVVLAVMVCELAAPYFEKQDSPHIVIDEIAGFLVTMTWLPVTWQSVLAGFLLFRILDAVKPGPIGFLDRKVKGAVGVVADDIAAGIFANLILQLVYTQTSLLGETSFL